MKHSFHSSVASGSAEICFVQDRTAFLSLGGLANAASGLAGAAGAVGNAGAGKSTLIPEPKET